MRDVNDVQRPMLDKPQWTLGDAAEGPLLAAIVETSGSVILGLHPDQRIFAWNRAAEDLFQTPRGDALGQDYVATFIAPEHQVAVAADIQAVLGGKDTLNFENDTILADGQRRTLLWNVSRVLDAVGTPIGIVAIGQDITARKEAEERFRLVFEHAQDGLLISDHSGVVDCNPAALRMLGLVDKAQLVGRRPAEFSPPIQPDGTPSDTKSRDLGAVTLQRGAHTFDWVHQQPDGTEVPVEVSVRHTLLNGRRVSVVAWRDQTRRLELDRERAIVQQRLDLAQKMEAVGQLAGGVAHDFNNLLAAIRNAVQLAMYELPVDSATRADLESALQTADRAAGLTRQLLAFSRRQTRATECIDLAALVRDTLPLLRSSIPPAVDVRIDADVANALVVGDRSQLEQVLLNLVLNARDAMPDGGQLDIVVRVDEARAMSLLTVTDTGVGIDELTRLRIFEPFFTTKALGTGSGLGLSVVYGVVTQAGGTVRADSALGQGTTMHVELPLSMLVPQVSITPATDDGDRADGVLLVDDDEAVRTTTRRLLARHGWRVLEAGDGEAALAQFVAHRDQIAIVLTDLRMPVMDGVQLALRIRRLAPDFPVVFFSGYDELEEHSVEGMGDVPLIAKPFGTDDLLRVMADTLAAAR
ncbi:hybrid sensor histidine kinase/response regulator [Gemmatimonas groenlandica]|uniref:histidine kinase n=1 Tax=Gemmatimonas groenlandica TaxID=2732249 RepID=A0A6M4ILX5_9BACT|nr:PAS domain S-box protein [Gemmatimonas groenlandica]QJR34406.1 PAS domain S-box protein [Gemmatimonas groenlandica]